MFLRRSIAFLHHHRDRGWLFFLATQHDSPWRYWKADKFLFCLSCVCWRGWGKMGKNTFWVNSILLCIIKFNSNTRLIWCWGPDVLDFGFKVQKEESLFVFYIAETVLWSSQLDYLTRIIQLKGVRSTDSKTRSRLVLFKSTLIG